MACEDCVYNPVFVWLMSSASYLLKGLSLFDTELLQFLEKRGFISFVKISLGCLSTPCSYFTATLALEQRWRRDGTPTSVFPDDGGYILYSFHAKLKTRLLLATG